MDRPAGALTLLRGTLLRLGWMRFVTVSVWMLVGAAAVVEALGGAYLGGNVRHLIALTLLGLALYMIALLFGR